MAVHDCVPDNWRVACCLIYVMNRWWDLMKSVKQGPGAWFSHSCLWFGAVCLSGPCWSTEPRGDGSGHRGSSLWVMIYQPGVFKALLILLSITGPPFCPPAPPCSKLHNQFGEGVAVRCALQGNDRTLMLQIRAAPAQMGSLALSLSLSLSSLWESGRDLQEWGLSKRNENTACGNVPNY